MGVMVRRAKTILGNNDFTALFDKGYHTGSELEIAQGLGIKTLVAIPSPASNATDPRYNVQNFTNFAYLLNIAHLLFYAFFCLDIQLLYRPLMQWYGYHPDHCLINQYLTCCFLKVVSNIISIYLPRTICDNAQKLSCNVIFHYRTSYHPVDIPIDHLFLASTEWR
jgi:hypothetical protein